MRADAIFYNRDDIADILGYGCSKAYKVIRELNAELEAKDYLIRPGKISKKYFNERFGVGSNKKALSGLDVKGEWLLCITMLAV